MFAPLNTPQHLCTDLSAGFCSLLLQHVSLQCQGSPEQTHTDGEFHVHVDFEQSEGVSPHCCLIVQFGFVTEHTQESIFQSLPHPDLILFSFSLFSPHLKDYMVLLFCLQTFFFQQKQLCVYVCVCLSDLRSSEVTVAVAALWDPVFSLRGRLILFYCGNTVEHFEGLSFHTSQYCGLQPIKKFWKHHQQQLRVWWCKARGTGGREAVGHSN